jgi:hypothetical protein
MSVCSIDISIRPYQYSEILFHFTVRNVKFLQFTDLHFIKIKEKTCV